MRAGSRQFPDERQVEDAVDLAKELVLGDERIQVNTHLRLRIEFMHSLHGGPPSLRTRGVKRSETPSTKQNQAESQPAKLLFFNRPVGLMTQFSRCDARSGSASQHRRKGLTYVRLRSKDARKPETRQGSLVLALDEFTEKAWFAIGLCFLINKGQLFLVEFLEEFFPCNRF